LTINTDNKVDANIVAQGKVQGLVRGGFIHHNNNFELPANGTFIKAIDGAETKYSNALAYYTAKVGSPTDLLNSHKTLLNITKSQLLIKGTDGFPAPSTFTIDHNYHEGSITYNGTYNRNLALSIEKGYTNISITRQDPVDIIQEFIVPGRLNGPIIQKLGTKTARTVSVTIEGADPANTGCFINDICSVMPQFSIPNFDQLISDNNSWIKTREDYTVNKLDGSYSISLEYTLKGNC
jgi:hypothetical protein